MPKSKPSAPSNWPTLPREFRRPARSPLLQSDPKTQGPKLFRQHCAAATATRPKIRCGGRSAVDRRREAKCFESVELRHARLGSRDSRCEANRRPPLLRQHGLQRWRHGHVGPGQHRRPPQRAKGRRAGQVQRQIDDVTLALAAEAADRSARSPIWTSAWPPAARLSSRNSRASIATSFASDGELGNAPDLTGYASREWLTAFLSNPADKRFYGDKNDRMPAFALHPNDPCQSNQPAGAWLCSSRGSAANGTNRSRDQSASTLTASRAETARLYSPAVSAGTDRA